MKIYDCFTFFNELDLLEIRLNELNDSVDYFVIVEANKTHTGIPKEYIFEKNKKKFKKFLPKIIYVKINSPFNKLKNSWVLENYQRNQIINGLKNCKPEDIIFISDLDEIPNKKDFKKIIKLLNKKHNFIEKTINNINIIISKILFKLISENASIKNKIFRKILKINDYIFLNQDIILLRQQYYFYYLNGKTDMKFITTRVLKYKTLIKEYNGKPHYLRYKFNGYVIDSGWHFSYLGGINAIKQKIKSISESNLLNINEIKTNINNNLDMFGKHKITYTYIDKTYPKYIIKNKNKLIRKKYVKTID